MRVAMPLLAGVTVSEVENTLAISSPEVGHAVGNLVSLILIEPSVCVKPTSDRRVKIDEARRGLPAWNGSACGSTPAAPSPCRLSRLVVVGVVPGLVGQQRLFRSL